MASSIYCRVRGLHRVTNPVDGGNEHFNFYISSIDGKWKCIYTCSKLMCKAADRMKDFKSYWDK